MPCLSTETVRLLRLTFADNGHHPSEDMWRGIENLAAHLERMAGGQCEPRFYLSSLDPGVGKTQTVIHFLRALIGSPLHDDVGVIIFFFTKQQIEEVVTKAGLKKGDYAVLMTPREEAEQKLIDSGSANHNEARVLFTTQQRLQLLCKEKTFSDVDAYHFHDHPRQVRIWDEALSAATEVIVRAYAIADLLNPMSALSKGFMDDLDKLRTDILSAADREVFLVPNLSARHKVTLKHFLRHGRGFTTDEKKLAEDLWFLFGKYVSIRDDGNRGRAMVSFRESLPPDLAPLVILDASGRIRTAYDWWQDHRDTLERLRPVPKRYDQLTVHVWDIGGGQASFETEEGRYWRSSGIIKTINSKPEERWLVVCHKKFKEAIEKDIRRELSGDEARVSFLYWGIHRASNEFCDVPNIILAGTQFLAPSSYEGIGRAARRLWPNEGEITNQLQRQIERGELADRVLQAVCRGVVRKAVGDQCPPCNVYIIARAASGLLEQLPRIFPGCRIEPWEPSPPRLKGKPATALQFIKGWLQEHPDDLLEVQLVMNDIGVTNRANFNKNVRDHAGFKLALGQEGIYEVKNATGRRCLGFRQALEDEEPLSQDIFLNEDQEPEIKTHLRCHQ